MLYEVIMMAKVKFRYNPETLSYDKIERGFKYYFSRGLLYFLFIAVLGLVSAFTYLNFFDSPKEKRLKRA